MAPRAYWKGTLKLSLVTCPVVLYPASTSVEKTRFHMINKETGNRRREPTAQRHGTARRADTDLSVIARSEATKQSIITEFAGLVDCFAPLAMTTLTQLSLRLSLL
jgi:hypothetical protein